MNDPVWIFKAFQQRIWQNPQSLKNDTFCRLPVNSAQCIIGLEKYPDADVSLGYDVDDDHSQGYSQIKETFRASTTKVIFQLYLSDHDFRSWNNRVDDVGYKLYVFDIRHQQNFSGSQPIEVELKFDGVVSNKTNGYVLVLTNKLVSVKSDRQKHFDLI